MRRKASRLHHFCGGQQDSVVLTLRGSRDEILELAAVYGRREMNVGRFYETIEFHP